MKDKNGIKQKIVDILSNHPEGLPIAGLSRFIGSDRYTVTKYLHELIGAGLVQQRDFKILKINYLTKTAVRSVKRGSISGKSRREGRQ